MVENISRIYSAHNFFPNITLIHNCHYQIIQLRKISEGLISSLINSWSWALLEKPPIVQLLKNFPAFYGTRRFITVFTKALH
jgi:hypothetical protein